MNTNHRAIVFLQQNIRNDMRTDRNHPVGEWMIEPLAKRRFKLQGESDSYDFVVDYIETSGTAYVVDDVAYIDTSSLAYIDTGIKVGPDITFHLDFFIPASDNLIQVFGGREDAYTNQLYFYNDCRDSNYPAYWRYGDKNISVPQLAEGRYVFDNTESANVLYINDNAYTANNPSFVEVNSNFYLFTLNTQADGTAHPALANMQYGMRFYGGQIYKRGRLVRDFIPVVKNDVGYLYDKITKKLYGNANSKGAFTYT